MPLAVAGRSSRLLLRLTGESVVKVIAFLGSPRPGGNSDTLLSHALRAIDVSRNTVRLYRLDELNIAPCRNCGACESGGGCVVDDDMQDIYRDIREADRIIVASPIFFMGLAAQTKLMIDRCQPFWYERYVLKRPIPEGPAGRKGLLLVVGGMKKETGGQCAEATATAFFRSVSVAAHETLIYLGIDEKGAIGSHPTALGDAFEAGTRLMTP
jgi:multimeric flavodoxin WrbA